MLLTVSALLALNFQVQIGPSRRRPPTVRDSITDSTGTPSNRRRNNNYRKAVTADLLATAYKDQTAKTTLLHARTARLSQDSALTSYDAMSYQRISAGLGFTKLGRDRLLFRHESAARVRWQAGVGIWMEAKGQRTALPAISNAEAKKEINDEVGSGDMNASIPYFPGYEPLWIGNDVARAQVDESEIVNPIADGAEAYYTYETGDSISFRLPNQTSIQLRELRIRPRVPKWNLAVGSLWFDTKSGQLVRAAYRLSIPLDIWQIAKEEDPTSMDDVPVWVKPMISPMKAEISAIAIEYGLHEGRFWMPRLRLAEGSAQVSFMRVPFKMEESFKYASVNGKDSLPRIPVTLTAPRTRMPDSLNAEERQAWRDSVRAAARARTRATADSIERGLRPRQVRRSQCDTSDTRTVINTRDDGQLLVALKLPCDMSKLENSPELPGSIYDKGEELFGAKDLEALKNEALSMTAQAPFSFRLQAGLLPPPIYAYGPSMMRYNRVEGLSFGASVEQQFGGGYTGTAVGRLGVADWEPNIELTGTRSNVSNTIGLSLYNHLVSASDWGRPLSFGSSFSSLMFGRDEGFYYRSTGFEVNGNRTAPFGGGARIDWRAFLERQRTAAPNTNFAVNGADFPANLVARRGSYAGVGARLSHSYGLDPRGLRIFSDLRFEGAMGDSSYGRAALDVTTSHGLGQLAAALTLSGGSSVGSLPAQRYWYLGGNQTIRGQSPDTAQSGNAFWMARAELGQNTAGVRPTLFADFGWVGSRDSISKIVRPMSGVGAGVSFLDGLFRFDVARGIYPRKQNRVDLYLEAKF